MLSYSNNKETNARPAASNTRQVNGKPATIQAKLNIGKPNDRYEQEADNVADKVVNQSAAPQQIQTKCAACSKEEKVQRMAEEEQLQAKPMPLIQKEEKEEMQMKSVDGKQTASAEVSNQIHQTKGAGSPLPSPIQQQMESGIGADFSGVRIHTDAKAQNMSQQLNAQAFTVGNDIYFNKDKYSPSSTSGQHLLAHELTHTVQQGTSVQRMIQKQDKDPYKTDKEGFTFGRAPHHHPPGNWEEVQRISAESCANPNTKSRKRVMDCLCAVQDPKTVVLESFAQLLVAGPIPMDHMIHYMEGTGDEKDVSLYLELLIKRDKKVRLILIRNMKKALSKGETSGHFMIRQEDYSNPDMRYALGGVDRVDWKYDHRTNKIDVWFKDPYDFHPVYPGDIYKNVKDGADRGVRDTNCVHAAAVELLAEGAAPYIMKAKVSIDYDFFDLGEKRGIDWDDLFRQGSKREGYEEEQSEEAN